ncbi:protein O-glucosyltransferase 2-like [Helicoverpa zea]|uniref:protein O-glucosyltransferase 2-like n=1 Tax=Helicoverpa zea TaxID=7113 RepID=UPI001F59F801|nr:protein O-glucosyltransferase 2-like [Helicoverpa zea]
MYLKDKIHLLILCFLTQCRSDDIIVTGPGLSPVDIVMPARYFFINFTNVSEKTYTHELNKKLIVGIDGRSGASKHCRVWVNKLDRKDGTFIVRYKIYETCKDLSIQVLFDRKHVANSPYNFNGPVHPDQCNCPVKEFQKWFKDYGCSHEYKQIEKDLKPFSNLDMKKQVNKIVDKYHQPESTSFCHYAVKNNKLYRKCYGKHVGFNMFSDNILLSLMRKVNLPDMELVINLGDWPLVQKRDKPLPVFSWCGSDETYDIVMPTYDLTESTLENMGRVTLDTLSVQSGAELAWDARESQAVWRGRDSRAERLKLVDIARANPDLFNVSLTNFFFFRDKEAQYGPKQPHISFFKFFDFKYQINVDGTVAAYRMPYLLAGGGVILKQDSPYYEHFYGQLSAWEHFIPIKRDLSDLVDRVKWAQENDEKARKITLNARNFANEHLLPQHVICYHAALFWEWSKISKSEVNAEDMTTISQPSFDCNCESHRPNNREDL